MKKSEHSILYLTAKEAQEAGANMELAISCVEQVLTLHEKGEVILPSKVVLDLDEKKTWSDKCHAGVRGGRNQGMRD